MEIDYGHVPSNTTLRRATRRVADLASVTALVWTGVTFALPLGLRAYAIPLFMVAVFMYAVDHGLGRVEPRVSDRLFGWVGGESA